MRTSLIRGLLIALAAASLCGTELYAQPAPESALDFLVGVWEGEGELFGQPASFHMTWSRLPGEDVYRLQFRNALGSGAAAQTILESEAMYTWKDGALWDGTWFDSRDKRLELSGSATGFGTAFRVEWTDPGVENGVTIYRQLGQDRVEVVDSVASADGMRLFGTARYARTGRE